MQFDSDVVVVGLGAMGSQAVWRLAVRGVSVIGIERFHLGHDQGSSHGQTRIFRVACLEHPNLVTMARRSRELFDELEEIAGVPMLHRSGAITIGPPGDRVITGALAAAAAHDLPIEQLDRRAIGERLPQHAAVGDDHVGIWDPEAGLAHPESMITAAVDAARGAGATIYTDTRVTNVELLDGGVRISTGTRSFTARQAVVTAGPWLAKLVPDLPLQAVRTPMTWFTERPEASQSFAIDHFPTFIRAFDDGPSIWGHGSGEGFGIKIGPGQDPNFRNVDPDTIDRYVGADDWRVVSQVVDRAFPQLEPVPARTTTCMITETPDGQFVIGRPSGDPRLIIGGGGSGHAFKHAPGIGELIAQCATDEPAFMPTDFVDPDRFATSTASPGPGSRTLRRG